MRILIDGRHRLVQRARLERVAQTCPLRRSIEAGIEFDEQIVLAELPNAA